MTKRASQAACIVVDTSSKEQRAESREQRHLYLNSIPGGKWQGIHGPAVSVKVFQLPASIHHAKSQTQINEKPDEKEIVELKAALPVRFVQLGIILEIRTTLFLME
jgi:hypothetical protein